VGPTADAAPSESSEACGPVGPFGSGSGSGRARFLGVAAAKVDRLAQSIGRQALGRAPGPGLRGAAEERSPTGTPHDRSGSRSSSLSARSSGKLATIRHGLGLFRRALRSSAFFASACHAGAITGRACNGQFRPGLAMLIVTTQRSSCSSSCSSCSRPGKGHPEGRTPRLGARASDSRKAQRTHGRREEGARH